MLVIDWRIFVDFLFFRYFRLTSLLIKISPILFPFLFHPTFFFFFFYSYQLTFAFDRHAFTSEHAHTFKYMQAYSHPLIQLHIHFYTHTYCRHASQCTTHWSMSAVPAITTRIQLPSFVYWSYTIFSIYANCS